MTQSSTSDRQLPTAFATLPKNLSTKNRIAPRLAQADDSQPAICHPNFDPSQSPLDPARALTDIPEPARRINGQLRHLYGKPARPKSMNADMLSPWQLVASQPFAEHLDLLRAAQLIELPDSFYQRPSAKTSQSLLTPLTQLRLLDLADIEHAMRQQPRLTRYGFDTNQASWPEAAMSPCDPHDTALSFRTLIKRFDCDELLSAKYADDWQVILQPQQFEDGVGSLATDIIACSVAVHALQQCRTRKTINQSYSAHDICEYVRHYVLSQIYITPAQRHAYRQVRVFTGHIIIAAIHLGWQLQIRDDGHCHFNLSSRSGLLTRYANLPMYAINGWRG